MAADVQTRAELHLVHGSSVERTTAGGTGHGPGVGPAPRGGLAADGVRGWGRQPLGARHLVVLFGTSDAASMTTDDHHDTAAPHVGAENGGAPFGARLVTVVTGAGTGIGRAVAESLAAQHDAALAPLDLDVLPEPGCRSAVDAVLARQGRIDLQVDNAGMLISEPFLGPCTASTAAGEALADALGFEAAPFGVDTVIVVPGASTDGKEHFAHRTRRADAEVVAQYGQLPGRANAASARLAALDAERGASPADVWSVAIALADILRQPRGMRPRRVHVDPQGKGADEIDAQVHGRPRLRLEPPRPGGPGGRHRSRGTRRTGRSAHRRCRGSRPRRRRTRQRRVLVQPAAD